jgi:hypothetical protein
LHFLLVCQTHCGAQHDNVNFFASCQSGHADLRYHIFLGLFSGSAHAIGEHRLGPLISGLLRTTIREKLTFRDVATMQQIADWLKMTLPRTRPQRRRLAEIAN